MRRIAAIVGIVALAGSVWWWMSAGGERDAERRKPADAERVEPEKAPDLRGRVVDSRGEPVERAVVEIGGEEVRSGDNGRFEIRNLGSGEYEADVRAEGFVQPGPEALRKVPVEIPSAEADRPVELELTVRRPATLAGRVVADGEPVVDVPLTLYYQYAEGFRGGLEPFTSSGEGRADQKGRFELTNVAPGRLHVMAEPKGRASKQTSELLIEAGDRRTGLVIDLAPQGVVAGTVVGTDGKPLAAQITLSGERLPRDRRSEADADGEFRFDSLPAAEYRLRVTAPGYRSKLLGELAVDGDQPTEVDVELTPGEGVYGRVIGSEGKGVSGAFVRIRSGERVEWRRTDQSGRFQWGGASERVWSVQAYSPEYASSRETSARLRQSVTLQLGEGGYIRGRVVDADGEPVPGAELGVGAMVVDGPRPYGNRRIGRETIDRKDGRFEFGPLRPGDYELEARADGYASSSTETVAVRDGGRVGPVTVVLGRGGVVRGEVVDESTGEPVSNAAVSLYDMTSPFRPRRTTTDEQGGFELERVPAGRRSLRINRDGYLTRVLSGLNVPEGGSLQRTVELHEKKKGEKFGFRGIGAGLRKTDQGAAVRNVMPGGGAAEKGLQEGDVIHTVDGQPIGDMPLPEVVQKIRGPAGEPVRLTLERDGRGEFSVEIPRSRVVVDGRN